MKIAGELHDLACCTLAATLHEDRRAGWHGHVEEQPKVLTANFHWNGQEDRIREHELVWHPLSRSYIDGRRRVMSLMHALAQLDVELQQPGRAISIFSWQDRRGGGHLLSFDPASKNLNLLCIDYKHGSLQSSGWHGSGHLQEDCFEVKVHWQGDETKLRHCHLMWHPKKAVYMDQLRTVKPLRGGFQCI